MNFNNLSRKPPHVPYIFQISREDHDRKRASHLIFTKIDEMYASGANFHAQHFSGYALGFTDVLRCLGDRQAIGCLRQSRQT